MIYKIEIRFGLQFQSIQQRNEYLRIVKEIQIIEHRTQLKFTSVQEKQYYDKLLLLLKQIEERSKVGLKDDEKKDSDDSANKSRFILITMDKYKVVYVKLSQQLLNLEENYSIIFESEEKKIEYIVHLMHQIEFERYKEYNKMSDQETVIYNQLIVKIKKIEEKIGINDLQVSIKQKYISMLLRIVQLE